MFFLALLFFSKYEIGSRKHFLATNKVSSKLNLSAWFVIALDNMFRKEYYWEFTLAI